jgi:hypothetical protein
VIEYTATEQQKAVREAIVADGKKVGEVWPSRYGFQCQLRVDDIMGTNNSGLTLNGIGATKGEAIASAVAAARRDAELLNFAAFGIEAAYREQDGS